MSSRNLSRAAFGLALTAIVTFAGTAFAQDETSGAQKKGPVSVRLTRPFVRPETPANQAPNVYDASSDEFNYFREDLGRQEMSSKQRARLEELASRVVYSDPMDKPAADGSKFVDIYSLDEVTADGEIFPGLDDPDMSYKDCEHNILAEFAKSCEDAAQTLSILSGGVKASDGRDGSMGAGMSGSMSGSMSDHPMPGVTMDPVMMEDGKMAGGPAGGPGSDSKGGAAAAEKVAEPTKNDDSALIFPDDPGDNPFDGSVETLDEEFDFFQADREFEPKAEAPKQTMSGSMGGPGATYDDK